MDNNVEDSLRSTLIAQLEALGGMAGNQRLRAAMETVLGREIAQEAFDALRESLIAEEILGRGKGRGGSVYLIGQTDKEEEADDEPFTLEHQERPAPEASRPRKAKETTPRGTANQPSQVLSYRHGDKRKNNPHVGMVDTTSDGVENETRWAYDPHIDPALQFDSGRAGIENLIDDALASGDPAQMRATLEQLKRMQAPYLNWSGKAERTSFEVDTVSLHVHERIDPATILAALQKQLKNPSPASGRGAGVRGGGTFQPDLFSAPFENLPLRDAIDFYKHERDWANRLISGDSLLVMNSLLQKEGMAGQVQMIYIDPPYGIKYGSNFQPFTHKRDVKDRKDEDLTQEPEMIKAFRDTWELGIHSYLTYLRDRLLLAKELLIESGSVFVQISDENLHHVREVMDEVFGAGNFVSLITVAKTSSATSELLAGVSDYLVWYARDSDKVKYRQLFKDKEIGGAGGGQYSSLRYPDGQRIRVPDVEKALTEAAEGTRVFRLDNMTSQRPPGDFPVEVFGKQIRPANGYWKTGESGMRLLARSGRLDLVGKTLCYVRYIDDFPVFPYSNLWTDTVTSGFSDKKVYVVQTNANIVERCLLMTTDPCDLVLDPTCGSGTTAFVAEKWGRRWITCDTSRVAVTLAKQRLLTAGYDYYELKYPQEGLRGGFIYKTVPHVTLKSIANNPEIDEIYERLHPAIEKTLADLNESLVGAASAAQGRMNSPLQEWEVPFDFPPNWPESARAPFDAFHAARQAMQRQMDASIAAHADQETLFDQAEKSKTKLRITGPFTVEAVPFPTVLALEPNHDGEGSMGFEADVAVARSGVTSRQAQWRDELLKTGIRGKAGQMLKLIDLEPLPGARYIHAVGTVAESSQRVAVSFGPEHAALEQRQVEIAMREAGELFPLPKMLVFCAFTFDPEAAKDIDNIKGITALKVQMNTDLLTEDLKKARAGNQSFWLMGQPDVELRHLPDGRYEVEVHGFDYFDTSSGELRSGGKKQIAMWALDTDYDNRSLFPQQVFFPMAGAKEGWNKLKRDIRAELNEVLLAQFHGTVSIPFMPGNNRCIAVKIVDDRGIESLKVIPLE
ncbi:MAG: site-specific DNA-methyltransferase [Gammaproteobacteria bacterium]|nr:site-specific DNA-methyltransferase [Gammaproteobacteria bacterium]MBU1655444.1 site-specific DNA-methyltransferase [Gammaproteobacteria bacterium]MBU1962411.1 site-specific DNA-methyltransferase [Gammaproteobacteria bacterium]